MMGDDDAAFGSKYTKTVCCKSFGGEVLAMNLSDFLVRVKLHDETWKFITNQAIHKNANETVLANLNQ